MKNSENRRIIAKSFDKDKDAEWIRLPNDFVNIFLFEDKRMVDIPITALRIIANVISIIRDHQFQPQDRPFQLSLFEDNFEIENNMFAHFSLKNAKISPSRSHKQIILAYEFLTKYKMAWYESINSQGKIIKTYGGFISLPSYENRGSTSFLVSSYWLKKIIVMSDYNYVLFNLVFKIKNNKHILFVIWLNQIPEIFGTTVFLENLNKRFGLNYANSGDFCSKFLRPLRVILDQMSNLSFHYNFKANKITIVPVEKDLKILNPTSDTSTNTSYRVNYLKNRFQIEESDFNIFKETYSHSTSLIEKSYSDFVKAKRLEKMPTTFYSGRKFLQELQHYIIENYRESKAFKILPNGYPKILR